MVSDGDRGADRKKKKRQKADKRKKIYYSQRSYNQNTGNLASLEKYQYFKGEGWLPVSFSKLGTSR